MFFGAGSLHVVSDFYNNPIYWLGLAIILIIASLLTKARLFDFKFLVLMYIGQYVLHSGFAFGVSSEVFVFCSLFLVISTFFICVKVVEPKIILIEDAKSVQQRIEMRWISFAKIYLLTYYVARLTIYPFFFGELFLDDRLSAQQENRALFFLSLAIVPAVAAVIYSWVCYKKPFDVLDYLVMIVVIVGLFGSGSKAAVSPIIIVYIGVCSYLNIKPIGNVLVFAAMCALISLSLYALILFFPALSLREIFDLVTFRIASNTDNIEYLYAANLNPRDFPFAGWGALSPMISKIFGYNFEFSSGVWMHGARFGEWRGFGPNSGLVLDYYGNFGWSGLVFAAILGLYIRVCTYYRGAVGCSFMAIAYIAIVDAAMFSVPLLVWLSVLFGLVLLKNVRFSKLSISSANRKSFSARLS